jgi:hypothetical protein
MSKRWLLILASAVVVLNLIDGIFTLAYTGCRVATESNPLMQGVLAASPVVFMITKLTLVSLCVLLLWRHGRQRFAIAGLVGTTVMYVLLIGYHISAVPRLLAQL